MEKLYQSFQKRIYDFLFKFTNNPETAMDLVQDTFLNYYKNYINEERTDSQVLMILYTIARNLSINHSKKFSTSKEIGGELDRFGSSTLSTEKAYELKDLESRLRDCLQELPDPERQAVLLKLVQDFTLQDISHVMGVSISTASRLVVKGTATLIKIAEQRGISL